MSVVPVSTGSQAFMPYVGDANGPFDITQADGATEHEPAPAGEIAGRCQGSAGTFVS